MYTVMTAHIPQSPSAATVSAEIVIGAAGARENRRRHTIARRYLLNTRRTHPSAAAATAYRLPISASASLLPLGCYARVKCARNQLPPCHRQHRLRCLHVCIKYNTEYSDQYRSAHPEVYTYATARPATSNRTRRQLNDRGICYIMYINSKNRASSTASAVCVPVIRKGSAL